MSLLTAPQTQLTPPRFLRALAARLGAGAAFEVWAAPGPGAPLFAEATGLRRREALLTAAQHRRRWPGAMVLVLDGAGAVVAVVEPARPGRQPRLSGGEAPGRLPAATRGVSPAGGGAGADRRPHNTCTTTRREPSTASTW